MRLPTALRLFVAVLAINGTLASPVLALAHGEAHEHAAPSHAESSHDASSDDEQEHGSPASRSADDAVSRAAASVVLAAEHDMHDAAMKPLYASLHVEATRVESLREHQALQWERQLGGPPVSRARGGRLPDGIPVGILALALTGDERVVPCAAGIDGEHLAGAPVTVGVQHDFHVILVTKGRVTLTRERHDPGGG